MDINPEWSVFAKDMVPVWRKQIARAKTSVVLVSPYLDSLVLNLFGKSNLDHSAITVLTDLRPGDNPQFYRKQLDTLKQLSELGYRLKYTDRIHAKVLIVDGQWFSLGSQNFTKFARRSKEVSAFQSVFDDQDVLRTIDDWLSDSKDIPYELILQLLDEVVEELKELEKADKNLCSKVDEIISDYMPPKAEEFREWRNGLGQVMRRHIDEMVDQGHTETKFTRMKSMQSTSLYEYGTYASLHRANSWTDLTQWRRPIQKINTDSERLSLQHLNFYPILFSDTGVMGFARIAESRITYIRSTVKRTEAFDLGGFNFDVTLEFPRSGAQISNISILLQNSWFDDIEILLHVIFDGQATVLVEDNIDEELAKLSEWMREEPESFKPLLESMRKLKSSPELLFELVSFCCAPFVFKTLGRGHKNVEHYAHGVDYRLGVTARSSFICLLAECIDSD